MNDVKSGFAVASITALAIASFASISLPCHAQGEEENQALFVKARDKVADSHAARPDAVAKPGPKARENTATTQQAARRDGRFEDFWKQLTRESGS